MKELEYEQYRKIIDHIDKTVVPERMLALRIKRLQQDYPEAKDALEILLNDIYDYNMTEDE